MFSKDYQREPLPAEPSRRRDDGAVPHGIKDAHVPEVVRIAQFSQRALGEAPSAGGIVRCSRPFTGQSTRAVFRTRTPGAARAVQKSLRARRISILRYSRRGFTLGVTS
jgi:hypothetical protein